MLLVTCFPKRVSSTSSRIRDHFVCPLLFPQCPEECPACSLCLPWAPGTARPIPHHHWDQLPRGSPTPQCPAGFSASKPVNPIPPQGTQQKYINSLVADGEEWVARGPVLFTSEAWQGRPPPGAGWWQGGEIECPPTGGDGLAGGTFA